MKNIQKSVIFIFTIVLMMGCPQPTTPDLGEPPVVDAGSNITVETGSLAILSNVTSSDPDGDDLQYFWSFSSLPNDSALSSFDILGSATSKAGFTPDKNGVYILEITVSDGKFKVSDTVEVTAQTTRPTANAGLDKSVVVNSVVTLDGSRSTDPDADVLSYKWDLVSCPEDEEMTNDDISNSTEVEAQFTPAVLGLYTFILTVSDGTNSATDTIVINSLVTINSPVANAGSDQTCESNYPVFLDGTGSYDDDGDTLFYHWMFEDKPETSGLTNADISVNTEVDPTFTPDVDGEYLIKLTVNDGSIIDTDTILIIAQTGLNRPTAVAGEDVTVETSYLVESLDGSGSHDPNDDVLNYSWVFVSKPADSTVENSDINGANTAYPEFVPDVNGNYELQLSVNDGVYQHADEIVVVANTHVFKPVAIAGEDIEADYNSNVNLDGSASFDPNGDGLAYNWVMTTQPSGSSCVLNNSDTVSPSFIPDVIGDYTFSCIVSDGVYSDTDEVVVIATPIYTAGDIKIITAGGIDIPMRYVPGGLVFPYGIDDSSTYGSTSAEDDDYLSGFWVAETETTNELVAAVLNWALDNGKLSEAVLTEATLSLHGQELFDMNENDCLIEYTGSNFIVSSIDVPNIGITEYTDNNPAFAAELEEYKTGPSQPAINAEKYPCSEITWYGTIKISNWLTEMVNGSVEQLVYSHQNTGWLYNETSADLSKTGFRLPESMEWECAARYLGPDEPAEGLYDLVEGYYWTKGVCPSGGLYSVADYTDSNSNHPSYEDPVLDNGWYLLNAHETDIDGNSSSNLVFHGGGGDRDSSGALISENIGGHAVGSFEVGKKAANTLGLYDMSGNVWELCFTADPAHPGNIIRRGGGFTSHYFFLRVGRELDSAPTYSEYLNGFRLFMSE